MRCDHPLAHSDAAKRMADNVNIHYTGLGWQAVGKWCAIKLHDGSSDQTLYDTRRDAVRHQLDEKLCTYVKITPLLMSTCEAHMLLGVARKAYDAGHRFVDPDHRNGGRELILNRGRPVETVASILASLGTRRR